MPCSTLTSLTLDIAEFNVVPHLFFKHQCAALRLQAIHGARAPCHDGQCCLPVIQCLPAARECCTLLQTSSTSAHAELHLAQLA